MRKLFVLVLFSFLFIVQGVLAAKTITFVTSGQQIVSCSDFVDAGLLTDAFYCQRLSDLGYNIKIINEQHVIDYSDTWRSYASSSDMIFIGNVSLRTADKTQTDRDKFCVNLYNVQANNRKFFFTPPHTTRSYEGDLWKIDGCVYTVWFGWLWPPPPYAQHTNNTFTQPRYFKVGENGIVTEKWKQGDLISLYTSSDHLVDIHNKSFTQWITMEVKPGQSPIDYYPLISSRTPYGNAKFIFWGLRDPIDYSGDGWYLFDNLVVDSMGDSSWSIDGGTVPLGLNTTANGSLIIWANVTDYSGKSPENAIVNFTILGSPYPFQASGNLVYENGLWKNTTTKLPRYLTYTLTINAYSQKYIRNSTDLTLRAGNITIDMINSSNTYNPGSNYLIRVSTWSGKNRFLATNVKYYILDSITYGVLQSGSLTQEGGTNIYNKTIANIPNYGDFILEVIDDIPGSPPLADTFGGNFKLVSASVPLVNLILATNKNDYKPLENVILGLTSDSSPTQTPKISIKDSNNEEILPSTEMDQIDSTHWNKSYSLGEIIPNGVYTAHVDFVKQGRTTTVEKTFNVAAWNLSVDTDQLEYNTSDNVEITVSTTNAYKNDLDIDANVSILYPNDTEEFLVLETLTGNDVFTYDYLIPSGAPSGRYFVSVTANDSVGRTSAVESEFFVGVSGEISTGEIDMSPSSWSIITIAGKLVSKDFTITNLGTTTAYVIGITVPSSLQGIISALSIPTSIAADGTGALRLNANTAGLSEGIKSGLITVSSSLGNATISTSVNIVGDLSAEADDLLDELHVLLPDITNLQQQGKDVSSILDLYNETENLLSDAKDKYAAEDYSAALSKIDQARDNISQLKSDISGMLTAGADYGLVIWSVAIVIVIAIAGITVYKFRKKILSIFKRGKEEEVEEVYTSPEGEYRTEYY
jgi:hypothetical protein